jgi:hypothetical protein
LQETAPSAQKTANEVAIFGRNIAEVNPILQQLTANAHLTAEAFGAVITPAAAKQADLFDQSMGHVKLSVEGLAQSFIQQFLPALTAAANEFAGWLSTSDGVRMALSAVGNAAVFVAEHL